ncbi:MAG: bacillithiol biosynthesis deacetylase BshB1 [Clostridiales bacterium]|nr:bacillithiol biosynthesis deacetylase BshB1 [Clostridiales bacterium]
MSVVDIVCIGAHPDDVEIGMGGTIAALVAEGHEVALIDLTDGEPTPAGSVETRIAEAKEAARLLGVTERRTLTLPNRYVFDSVEARIELAEVLRELGPRVVFAPYPLDAHPDHVAAAAIVDGARFYAKFTKTSMTGEPHYVPRLYRYLAVHLRLARAPAFVFDVSAHLDAKLLALRAYRSQFVANERNAGAIDSIEAAARAWGAMIGVAAGEPFFSEELIGVRSIETLV